MTAIDTNIVARFIMRDDPAQATIAERVLRDGAFIPLTVLLEAAWLLRSHYGLSREAVGAALIILIETGGVEVVDPALVRWAIGRAVGGADIADMIHLVAARHHGAFATFDRAIGLDAGDDAPVMVTTLA